jgi:error-prone DNA polymerase
MSLFQIESPGQMNLLSRTQPRCFRDLVIQVALFRPGPIQGGMVSPFLQRQAGLQEVEVPHPCLAPILSDTFGIIVFQEQILEICHEFAGLSMEESDRFRVLMSKWRDPGNMDAMGEQFMEGAIALHGVTRTVAQEVFRQVAAFVGYGFCRSHAAAFARTVYQSAYLKKHYPAAYMAAVMQHLPGFFPKSTVLEEARRLRVKLLPVCIFRSFTQVKEISETAAQALVAWQGESPNGGRSDERSESGRGVQWESPNGHREELWDSLLESVPLELPQWEALARAGAFEAICPRREALWRVGLRVANACRGGKRGDREQLLLDNQPFSPMSADFGFSAERSRRSYRRLEQEQPKRNPRRFEALPAAPLLSAQRDIPSLEPLTDELRLSWDFSAQGVSATAHPMSRHRPRLDAMGVTPLIKLKEMAPNVTHVKAAGWVLVRQRPPTAKGMVFVMIEDETDRLQVAVPPPQMERWQRVVLRCQVLLVVGRLEGPPQATGSLGRYRSIMLEQAYDLEEELGCPLLAQDCLGPAEDKSSVKKLVSP